MDTLIAQLVEYCTLNTGVLGSRPSERTIFKLNNNIVIL